jgi:hypothetical protein
MTRCEVTDFCGLRDRLWREYELFHGLRMGSDAQLRGDMKDSDWDAMSDGKHDEQWCIDRYRDYCRGRSVQAGNDHQAVRALIILSRKR